jgi:hypothetical protein
VNKNYRHFFTCGILIECQSVGVPMLHSESEVEVNPRRFLKTSPRFDPNAVAFKKNAAVF